MTLLIVLGSIVAYLFIGALIARASISALWIQAERRNPLPHFEESGGLNWYEAGRIRDAEVEQGAYVRSALATRVLFWPIAAPFGLLLHKADDANPHEQRRTIEAQRAEIDRLEHELGIQR